MRQLAGELGVSYETLRKWVIGSTAPNRQRTAEVARLLDVSVEFVTYGSTEPASGHTAVDPVEITESEWAHLENLRLAPPAEKERLKQEAAAVSEMARQMRREILASLGMNGEADAERVNKVLKKAPRHPNADIEHTRAAKVVPDHPPIKKPTKPTPSKR